MDETFVGGLGKFMHKERRAKLRGPGPVDKTAIVGVLNRGGEVRAAVVPDIKKRTLQGHVRANVVPGSSLYSDSSYAYAGLEEDYDHATVDHAVEYVNGRVHTNGLENFWSLLKRGLKGTYVSMEPIHLFRYLDEQVFRFNSRKDNDFGRFVMVLARVSGRRLTYRALTGAASSEGPS